MKKLLPTLIASLQQGKATLSQKKVTAGFDGFVDTIVRIIKEKKTGRPPAYFKTIQQFGNYINDKSGASFSLEVDETGSRLGGNMPILGNALGHLGVHVNCVGAMGYPVSHAVFAELSRNCKLYSFAEPGNSTAYEFNDGKILLGQNGQLNAAGWEMIKNKIGIDTLTDLYRDSDLLCLVNWSEIDASTDIWKGLLRDVMPMTGNKPLSFFDLSDCSKRSEKAIREAIMLLKEFSAYTKVALGLNHNEAKLVYQALFQKKAPREFERTGEKIFEKLEIETLVLHSSKQAIGYGREGVHSVKTFFVKDPAISTGAGDNFNAGLCAARLLEWDMKLSLALANAVAGSYVSSGEQQDLEGIIKYIAHAVENL
jgi:hypothetical protein